MPVEVMNLKPGESSNISGATYDTDTQELRVTFVNGGATYLYSRVPLVIWQGLQTASSKGSYFSMHIRNIFVYRKIG